MDEKQQHISHLVVGVLLGVLYSSSACMLQTVSSVCVIFLPRTFDVCVYFVLCEFVSGLIFVVYG